MHQRAARYGDKLGVPHEAIRTILHAAEPELRRLINDAVTDLEATRAGG